ncbi:uncharacterized protein J3R85_001614 [Psidium guajava]|nr:uncharacterized protein J3R85_001614 [Psidium guajava]
MRVLFWIARRRRRAQWPHRPVTMAALAGDGGLHTHRLRYGDDRVGGITMVAWEPVPESPASGAAATELSRNARAPNGGVGQDGIISWSP